MTSRPMQLLVSVRNATEAIEAAQAGADIVDVKEPNAGPLGFAGMQSVSQVRQAVGHLVPVSAALGECVDWLLPDSLIPDELTSTLQGLQFVKLGLAELLSPVIAQGAVENSRNRWMESWSTVRDRLLPGGKGTGLPQWVAVAYADHERAAAPAVQDVLDVAIQAGCTTLLIDTFCKDGSGTLNWLTQKDLLELRIQTRRHRLRLALAGQLAAVDLPVIRAIQPDIFAVRGAVCEGSDRTATVSATKVAALKALL